MFYKIVQPPSKRAQRQQQRQRRQRRRKHVIRYAGRGGSGGSSGGWSCDKPFKSDPLPFTQNTSVELPAVAARVSV